MSRGPGRVQRLILNLIAQPDVSAPHVPGQYDNHGVMPGPVGVPLTAIFIAVYGTSRPSRAQSESVRRAIANLRRQGLADTYGRRVCPDKNVVSEYLPWDNTTNTYAGCCGRLHTLKVAVGRPRTEEEEAEKKKQFAALMAMAKML